MKWFIKTAQGKPVEERFGPTETKELFGNPTVSIKGDKVLSFPQIPGIKGTVNMSLNVKAVVDAMTSVFGADFWKPITDIVVQSMPGRFGEAQSQSPHTIFIDTDNIVRSVYNIVLEEANKAASKNGILELTITPEVETKVKKAVAEQVWETLGHERTHDLDFQDVEKKIMETGTGSMSEVQESHGEQGCQAARSRFRMPGM